MPLRLLFLFLLTEKYTTTRRITINRIDPTAMLKIGCALMILPGKELDSSVLLAAPVGCAPGVAVTLTVGVTESAGVRVGAAVGMPPVMPEGPRLAAAL